MFVDKLATEADVIHRIGTKDPITIARILAIAPTNDELDLAIGRTTPRGSLSSPSSERIASIREILDALEST